MYISKENQRLYLSSWNYNAALILKELAQIIENNGGRIKRETYDRAAIISNRSIEENLKEYRDRKSQLESIIAEGLYNEKTVEALEAVNRKIEKLEKIDNTPVKVIHLTYIRFVLNDSVYYYQVDENPFFDFYFTKATLRGNKYSRDAALTEDNKKWLNDCFLYAGCAHADIVEAANLIFNMLVKAKATPIIRDSTRQRVPNTYNSGYHYETVYKPERTAIIDW